MGYTVDGYELGDKILERLKEYFKLDLEEFVALRVSQTTKDPFKTLVATIISQNTAERNTREAYRRLEERIGVSPEKIVEAGLEKIAESIRPAGLQEAKARAIYNLALMIIEKYGGDMNKLMSMGEDAVKSELKKIRGIGDKSVDVLLSNWGYPVVAIDTHVRRVARRLGLTSSSNYDTIRRDLHRFFREDRRLEAHLYLIKLGREVCRAKNPRCDICPLSDICRYYKENVSKS